MAGGVDHAAPSAVDPGRPERGHPAYRARRRLRHQPENRLQVARAYEAGGVPALADQSRRPQTSPTATPPELVAALLAVRHHHPTWGPRKLLRILRQQMPDAPWPARSTIALHLHRAGLVVTPRRVRRPQPNGPRLSCGAQDKDSFPNLRAPLASSAC